MRKNFFILAVLILSFLPVESKELHNCKWKNKSGTPCLTIFSAPNTSKITEGTLGKTVITKKQMIDSGYDDVRSLLEQVSGVDVYSDGPKGQKTSIFMRGTNSNHTLVSKIKSLKGKKQTNLIQQAVDLALLSQNMLKGESLTQFIDNALLNLEK